MNTIHGGDIYRNQVDLDFSININPMGMPKTVIAALHHAVEMAARYPDPSSESLKKAVSDMFQKENQWNIPKADILFGSGASELFLAIIHGIKPRKTIIPIPSFYGYEYAAKAGEGEIIYYEGDLENHNILPTLDDKPDLLFLANPNNPTGKLISRQGLVSLLRCCQERKITVILDECFAPFCSQDISMIPETKNFDNLIVVQAFTKLYSIPGVRLGYLVCANQMLVETIQNQLPEWNLSCFAQEAGIACASLEGFARQTAAYVKAERTFLEAGLKKAGVTVFPGSANFILVYSEIPLYQMLLERKILIRDCENFRGLKKGFYRIAVKTRKENETLLKIMGEINQTWNTK